MAVIAIVGKGVSQGIYFLRIALSQDITLAFGRFAGGTRFQLTADDYLYIGSAMGKKGASSLAGRLLRHATRSSTNTPQPIRPLLYTRLDAVGLSPKLPAQKHCHWHIDYLLDRVEATLTAVYALRTIHPLEATVARQLMAMAATTIPVPGFGASDDRGATHLLQVNAPEAWWQRLPALLQAVDSHANRLHV